eukprot:CAMPEP_0194221570 /NCGR_PEP_ID=MMETSP0156-20130528/30878_1 /TAXON_ID=33649 /ORGANISM="Thalassionema nitzschioides, Strain L26-B" /LENGTH=603 /DNA_ID=CAMNT_0038952015 /DNA_START=98 /DNA_END=1909 /DNA_ORIENTATION=-
MTWVNAFLPSFISPSPDPSSSTTTEANADGNNSGRSHPAMELCSTSTHYQTEAETVSVSVSSKKEESSNGNLVDINIDDAIERLGMGKFQWEILFAAGLCFAADAMEVLLLSFLAVILKVEWSLEEHQTDTILSIVFAGAMVGTLVLSPLGDIVGRRPVFTITASMIAVFGVLTAFVPDYKTFLFVRFMVGFGVGGLTVPFDTLAEFVPTSHRGTNLLYIELFWTCGTMLVPVAAWWTLGHDDNDENSNEEEQGFAPWKSFVILCSIPCIISTIMGILLVPESPRWLLTQGKHDKALDILRIAAHRNGLNAYATFPEGTRITDKSHHPPDSSTGYDYDCGGAAATKNKKNTPLWYDLFSPRWLKITLLLWGVWFGFAFLYYGLIITISLVFSNHQEKNEQGQGGMYDFDYSAIFISASSEIFGLLFVVLTVDRWGRVPTQSICYLFGGATTLLLGLCAHNIINDDNDDSGRNVLVFLSFLARMAMFGASCLTWVSTSEIFTTEIRATGHGAANAMARLGGFFVPYIITAGAPLSWVGIILFLVSIWTALISWQLPETAGKALGEAGDALYHDHKNDNNKKALACSSASFVDTTATTSDQYQAL